MDLQELHHRTGIPVRRLRYCVDHRLVPGLLIDLTPRQAGRPRKFADDVGFGIVLAAVLLDLGLGHEKIRSFISGLLEIEVTNKRKSERALMVVFRNNYDARGYLGDGRNVRIEIDIVPPYDSGWKVPGNPADVSSKYTPRVEVTLNLGNIRDDVLKRKRPRAAGK